jgi:hypothetical protein
MAATYHQLGVVSGLRGDLSGAESWYRKALEIDQSLGNRPGMALIYGQLGLPEAREDSEGALDWTVRCVALFPRIPAPINRPGTAPPRQAYGEVGHGSPARILAALHGRAVARDGEVVGRGAGEGLIALESGAFAIAAALGVVAWLGYQVAQGLRTGYIRTAGFRFSRTERPGEFWSILAVHVFVILLLVVVIALEATS